MSDDLRYMPVCCTRKELSCIIANLFQEMCSVCDVCETLKDEDMVLGGRVVGTDDDFAYIKVTEQGFEYCGPADALDRARGARCLYGTLSPSKKDGGAAE